MTSSVFSARKDLKTALIHAINDSLIRRGNKSITFSYLVWVYYTTDSFTIITIITTSSSS
ncbi:hypothetical protein TYRP_020601 [Tyrophagus putrescentiae]|nr:hypothetical protein TYRP_020601 [Tyrophagus putrescentiae]